jgi:hypothetical protein
MLCCENLEKNTRQGNLALVRNLPGAAFWAQACAAFSAADMNVTRLASA